MTKLILAIVFFIPLNSFAVNWVKVGESVDGNEYFFDQSSISRNGSEMSFTLAINYAHPTNKVFSDASEMAIDCYRDTKKTFKLIGYSKYNLEGEIIYKNLTPDAEWTKTPLNTAAAEIQDRVCTLYLIKPTKLST